jgi:ribosome-associated toxin RatA of RatAB toxin-antitoxin module
MKILLRIVLSIIGIVVLVVLGVYADGATMPIDHSVSVTGTVAAPPEKVFALITNIAAGPTWRPEVKSVEILPQDNTRDAWVEDLGSGMKMKFLATTTVAPDPSGHALRVVKLDDPSYGGTWTYDLSPGPDPNTTTLKITEDGFIKSPIYRFMMAHVFGPTKNLNDYMTHIQAAATK